MSRKLLITLAALGLVTVALLVGIIVMLNDDDAEDVGEKSAEPAPAPISSSDDQPQEARSSHDHRAPVEAVPASEENANQVLSAKTLQEIRMQLTPMVRGCAEPMRKREPPEKGRIVATFTVNLAKRRVTIAEVDLREDGFDDQNLADCVRRQLETADIDAPEDQIDGQQAVTLSFPVP